MWVWGRGAAGGGARSCKPKGGASVWRLVARAARAPAPFPTLGNACEPCGPRHTREGRCWRAACAGRGRARVALGARFCLFGVWHAPAPRAPLARTQRAAPGCAPGRRRGRWLQRGRGVGAQRVHPAHGAVRLPREAHLPTPTPPPQERQADWLLRAYGPAGAVPVPVLLDYLRAELATTAEAADETDAAPLGFSVPPAQPLHPQHVQQQQQQQPPDDGMDAVPVVDVAAGKHPRPSPGGRRGGGGGGAFGV